MDVTLPRLSQFPYLEEGVYSYIYKFMDPFRKGKLILTSTTDEE